MAQLIFHVESQYIHRLDEFHVVARSNNYLYAEFTFSDDWVGVKTALFSVEADNGETITKPMLIGADGTCEVPHEVLEYDNSQLEVSAFCGNRVTANVAVVPVHESGYNNDSAPDDPTPDVYTQILERMDDVEQIVVDKATEAESWAVGDTGTREGEETDNAKYYSEQASTSASTAATSASNASGSAETAASAATQALASESTTTQKASEVAETKTQIDNTYAEMQALEEKFEGLAATTEEKAQEAGTASENARRYAESASDAERNAVSSATDAAASAASVISSTRQAAGYANNAQNYASAADRSMQGASASERSAAQSATNAANFSTNAENSATSASDSASQAVTSASSASGYAEAANASKEAAEYAQGAAEDARDAAEAAQSAIQSSLSQIATNTQNIAQNTEDISQNTTDIADVKEDLSQLAENGYYTTETSTEYIPMTRGQITSNGVITINSNTAYCYLTADQESKSIQFDASQYKYNIAYFNGETVVSYTGWVEPSPIIIDSTIEHTSIGINLRKLSGTVPTDLSQLLWYVDGGDAVGNLATKDYAVAKQQDASNAGKPLVVGNDGIVAPGEMWSDKGRLCIYPDGFESRIKPDIYFKDGKFYADIDLEAYKISGSAVYVSLSGSDTSGNGTKEKPYATITKALTTTAKTIYLEEGTYIQGTHIVAQAKIGEKNLIGIGNVVLQGDSSGHYLTANGDFYCENVKFVSGNSGVTTHAFYCMLTDENTACFVGCEFSGAGTNGLCGVGGNYILSNCKAYGNKLDGFNYHDHTPSATGITSVPHVLEMDCNGYNNGTAESGSDSCNGSTAHDGARVIRLNGEYYNCYGGVIAEIARTTEGAPQTISVNYGVLAHDSTIPSSAKGASFWVSHNTKMYLYNCQCYGGDYDLSAENTGMIISRQLISGRDVPSVYKGANAQIYQY